MDLRIRWLYLLLRHKVQNRVLYIVIVLYSVLQRLSSNVIITMGLVLWSVSSQLLTFLQFFLSSTSFLLFSRLVTSVASIRVAILVIIPLGAMTIRPPFRIYWRLFSLLSARQKWGVWEQDGAFNHSVRVFLRNRLTYF